MFGACKSSHKISFKWVLFEFCGKTFEVASLLGKKIKEKESIKICFVNFFCAECENVFFCWKCKLNISTTQFYSLNFPTWLSIFVAILSKWKKVTKTQLLPIGTKSRIKKYWELRIVCWFPKLININFKLVLVGQTSIATESRLKLCFVSIN